MLNSGLRVAALLWSSATPLTAVEPGLAEWFDASFLTERGQTRAGASDSAEPPPDIVRGAWMLDAIAPGTRSPRSSHTLATAGPAALGAVDVPLSLWTHPSFPGGLDFGETFGISFGDFDADGFIDVFALMSAHLWRNVNGETWELVADLDTVLPSATIRYGASFGDYNNDGLPDIATEGRLWADRSDIAMHLLRNLGDITFIDVAVDPQIIGEQGWGDQETICWGDVDCDADLDLFLPVYPREIYPPDSPSPSPGNFFYRNLGPVGAGGDYVFSEFSAEARLDNVPGAARPEGAQFVDVDFDGDMDLYCGGVLYQNRSSAGLPDFAPMFPGSGIGFPTVLEEGAAFADYDLDGDYDLLIVYSSTVGVRIWENRGDGFFFGVESGVVESPFIGLNLGLSAEDWDNDGDIDFTTKQVFRRNMLVETGERSFIVASHDINPDHISAATPAWGDWDKDGDLDAAIGNWSSTGHFYENTLYDAVTPDDQRRYVRVRPVRDSTEVPNGLETEYAASVEIDIAGDDRGFRRKKFTASSAGYLNQNEYTLHFGLPDAPASGGEIRFDVIVDFPNLPSEGMWRVDKHVNPVLGNVDLATLASREIVVFRSGLVRVDRQTHVPSNSERPLLTTAGGGLIMPDPTTPMPAPVPAPDGAFVGVDFDTIGADARVRIREVILDGTLAQPVTCGEQTGTLLLWDVTSPGGPILVSGGLLDASTSDRNHRSYFHTDWLLDLDRRYRLVARVATYRATDIVGPLVHDDLTVNGGLGFLDALPCTGDGVSATLVDPTRLYVSFRFGPVGDDGSCVGDLDGSGGVGFADLSILLQAWGLSDSDANLDGSGAVGFADLTILLQAWGACSKEAM